MQGRTELPRRRGRSDHAGFRAVIKASARGRADTALATEAVRDWRTMATLEALPAPERRRSRR